MEQNTPQSPFLLLLFLPCYLLEGCYCLLTKPGSSSTPSLHTHPFTMSSRQHVHHKSWGKTWANPAVVVDRCQGVLPGSILPSRLDTPSRDNNPQSKRRIAPDDVDRQTGWRSERDTEAWRMGMTPEGPTGVTSTFLREDMELIQPFQAPRDPTPHPLSPGAAHLPCPSAQGSIPGTSPRSLSVQLHSGDCCTP